MDGNKGGKAGSFAESAKNKGNVHMIINQETLIKIGEKSTSYKVLCSKLCSKIMLDKYLFLCL